MKFAFFADTHVANYRAFAKPQSSGLNTRGEKCVEAIRFVREYCEIEHITHAFHGGDLFHIKGVIDVPVWNSVWREIDAFKQSGIDLVMIPGQHDLVSEKTGFVNALETLPARGFSEPTYLQPNMVVIPYTTDPGVVSEALDLLPKSEKCIVFGHLTIQGSETFSGYPLEGIDAKVFDRPNIKSVFLGDVHKLQAFQLQYTQINYVGCLLQNNFGDRGEQKGFFVVDDEEDTVTFVPVPSPEFKVERLISSTSQLNKKDFENAYVRVELVEGMSSEFVRDQLREWGVENYILLVGSREGPNVEEMETEVEMSDETLVRDWVESQSTNLSSERLRTVGSKIVNASKEIH